MGAHYYGTGAVTVMTGAVDAFMQALNTLLTANGWTAVDVISTSTGSREVVYKSTAIDSVAGNAAFVRVKQYSATVIQFYTYTDWDTSAHVGMNEAGAASVSGLPDAGFFYYIRINPYAFTFVVRTNGYLPRAYAGFLHRGLMAPRAGCTKTTSGYSAGVTSMNTANDMTGKLQVGQKVQIINYAHNNASANKLHAEMKVIASVSSSAVTFTTATNYAYDTGALIGQNVLPVVVSVNNGTSPQYDDWVNVFYTPIWLDGTSSGAPSQQAYGYMSVFETASAMHPGLPTQEFLPGMIPVCWNDSTRRDFVGYMYHWHTLGYGSPRKGDLLTDGTNNFVMLLEYTGGSNTALGPI